MAEQEQRRIFVAGASGVMGRHLLPLLVEAGHQVAGMTRTRAKAAAIEALGAEAVVADAFDATRLTDAIAAFAPDAVVHQLTDLPDDRAAIDPERNAAIRTEGTANLIAALTAIGTPKLVTASIAWRYGPERGPSIAFLEDATLLVDGVVLRYGQWYGPGTYHPDEPADPPRVHVATAARRTVDALDLPSGLYLVDDDGIRPTPVDPST